MPAIGCLLPVVLMFAGAAVAGVVSGGRDAVWGGVAGAAIGLAAMIALLWVFERIRRRSF
jgi:hypothetical protein